MNIAYIFSSIGPLIFSTVLSISPDTKLPLNSKHNLANKLQCYQCTNYVKLDKNKNISDIFKNCTQNIITCIPGRYFCGVDLDQRKSLDNYFACGIKIIRQRKSSYDYKVEMGCMVKESCFNQQPSLWKSLDYDIPTSFIFNECCEGDKCNQEENLTKAQKLLTTGIIYSEDHNKLCPGYSNNYRIITLQQPNTVKNINIDDGSNLLLTIDRIEDVVYRNRKSNYTGSIWSLQMKSNKRMLPLFSFNTAGEMYKFTNKINNSGLIKNNKIFYVFANSMHICNFTKEDESSIQYTYKLEGVADINLLVNIKVNPPAIVDREKILGKNIR